MSVRALAESAARSRLAARRFGGGFLALDYFGDADLLSLAGDRPVRALSLARDLGRPRTLAALARAALDLDWRAVVYSGGLENRPGLLRRLEERGEILGNGSRIVDRVRDPDVFFPFLRRAGIPHPKTLAGGARGTVAPRGRHLWKPIRSGGGSRIRPASPGEPRPRGFYAQEYLEGTPGSAAFVADGRRAVILGVTEQLAGASELGGSGFRYGGNIAGPRSRLLSRAALAVLERAADLIAWRFGLRGLNGLDFVLRDGVPHVLEINPRYTASMELLEEIARVNLFDLHLEALAGGRLPRGSLRLPRFLAKGILYATEQIRWTATPDRDGVAVRDRPARGETILAGRPICSLIVPGSSPGECRRRLARGAVAVRRALSRARRRPRAGAGTRSLSVLR